MDFVEDREARTVVGEEPLTDSWERGYRRLEAVLLREAGGASAAGTPLSPSLSAAGARCLEGRPTTPGAYQCAVQLQCVESTQFESNNPVSFHWEFNLEPSGIGDMFVYSQKRTAMVR